MLERISSRAMGSCGVVALALASAAACSQKDTEIKVASPETQPSVFTFAPPDGITFTRTEKRLYESALTGSSHSKREEHDLRWRVSIGRGDERFVVQQELTHVATKLDGTAIVDADILPGAIVVKLFVDRTGTLVDVGGLENVPQTASPNGVSKAELKELVAMRYDVLTGELVGRPFAPGTSWTVPGRPSSAVTSRTVTVERLEPCDTTTCARIREDVRLDADEISTMANKVVKDHIIARGGDPSTVTVKEATYTMSGVIVTDPLTMLTHEAGFVEVGRVVVRGPTETFEVTTSGKTEFVYDYGTNAVASR